MKKTLIMLAILLLCGCARDFSEKSWNQGINIIPQPNSISVEDGNFLLTPNASLNFSDESVRKVAEFYASRMRRATGFALPVTAMPAGRDGAGSISLCLDESCPGSPEGYELAVTPEEVVVRASSAQGLFYGMASLMQLFPSEIDSPQRLKGVWRAPAVQIKDQPRFPYRGLMLDVARHFISVEGVKKHIDLLAEFKINKLHLHLTDHQGWRIEIKKYPALTAVGSKRTDEYGNPYGGFYTQDDIREIVAYAAERFIDVIPEIDVPGHTRAAIAAYPELSCTGEPAEVMNRWGGHPVIMCPGKETMFEMLDGIFAELSELFPSEYFHIGGDECPKTTWKECPYCQQRIREEGLDKGSRHSPESRLQSYAIARCEKILHSYGKKMIGWDEILQGGLAPDATVMSWRGEKGGIASALSNHNVIMSPNDGGMYINHYQASPYCENFSWGAFDPISKTYAYDPVPEKLAEMHKEDHVLGVQGNLWTECVYSEEGAEYKVYPRILAVAEVGWTGKESKDFNDFSRRLYNAAVRMDLHGIRYYIPVPQPVRLNTNHIAFLEDVELEFMTDSRYPLEMVYTTDGTEPGLHSKRYEGPLSFSENTLLKIRSVLPSGVMSDVRTIELEHQEWMPAAEVDPVQPGLKLRIAETHCLYAAGIPQITQWKDSVITNVERVAHLRENANSDVRYYVSVAETYVLIPETAIYDFASENTRVWMDGKLVVDNDGKPQRNSIYGRSLALEKGWHAMKIEQISGFFGGWNSQHRNPGSVRFRKQGTEEWKSISRKMVRFNP